MSNSTTNPSHPSPTLNGTAVSMTPPCQTTSLQNTPDCLHPMVHPRSSLPSHLILPDTPISPAFIPSSPPTSSPTAMSEAMAMTKSPNLIRRISHGARRVTQRRSSNSQANRDQSCGPVMLRRRSDSKGTSDIPADMSDLELDHPDEEDEDSSFGPYRSDYGYNSVGLSGFNSPQASVASLPEGPTRSPALEQGMVLVKVTKRKRKPMVFWLDYDSAKVSWQGSRKVKSIYIDDISDIRVGSEATVNREECGVDATMESGWFTIVHTDPDKSKGRTTKTMNLIAPDDLTFKLWTTHLNKVSRERIEIMVAIAEGSKEAIRKLWRSEMERTYNRFDVEEEKIDLATVRKLCRKLEINCADRTLKYRFENADSDGSGFLTFPQFECFVDQFKERKDITRIYHAFKHDKDLEMDMDSFFFFLQRSQGVDVHARRTYWEGVFRKFALRCRPKGSSLQDSSETLPLSMNNAGFQAFLLSDENSVLEGVPKSGSFKLDRPLNEYFINSSHNTYLTGRQIADRSSTEAYIMALQNGCRCIEIDCWDGPDGRPLVTHGRSLTSKVLFADCIAVIARYAFSASPYPLIISLEVHCNPEQQTIMTRIMKDVFGDKLLTKPIEQKSSALPSPEELKGKILIKVKGSHAKEEYPPVLESALSNRERSLSSPISRPIIMDTSTGPNSPLLGSPYNMSPPERAGSFFATPREWASSVGSPVSSAEDSDYLNPPKARKKAKPSKITKVLGELGVYTQGVTFSSFKDAGAKTFNHVFSLSEGTFKKAAGNEQDAIACLEKHNKHHLMRVYPGFYRVSSDNFNPLKPWRHGVQMSALNWQTYDIPMQLNQAMFAAGADRTGYVLKPKELRPPEDAKDILREITGRKIKTQVKFSVEIVSVQQLPRPRNLNHDANLNPYVMFEMYSAEDKGSANAYSQGGIDDWPKDDNVSGIDSPLRRRTHIAEGNGFDPMFNETIAMSVETKNPSLIFVRWTIYNSSEKNRLPHLEDKSVPLATYTAKLSSLREGYRHLRLYDATGTPYMFSSLFVKIKKERPVNLEENPSSPSGQESSRGIFQKLLSRTPSGRKKERGNFSRSNTLDR
ncbi:PLC-like phosphodiesterase [Patellaria atrata CBS 101060]|uniref:Phosphoinositide phospholipase C n=1 Tax=Patellaria atrata CBS 101060 TaxID=1346257 RepID=A0A9P4S974_9PEZI|nr:PLC-like phosphodiesterase [Patellaria atrata CBS 101060]